MIQARKRLKIRESIALLTFVLLAASCNSAADSSAVMGTGVGYSTVSGWESTSSNAYADLPGGPSVEVTVPASGRVIVISTARVISHNGQGYMIVTPGGNDARALVFYALNASGEYRGSVTHVVSNLPAGPLTFTAKYRVGNPGGSVTFGDREITVIPLP